MSHTVLATLAAVAVGLGAVSQSTTGFGFSLVCAPFLVAAYRAPAGVQLNLVLSVALNLVLLGQERRGVDGRAAALLLVPAGVATFAVGGLIRLTGGAHSSALTIVAGGLCLAGVAAVASGRRSRHVTGRVGTAVVGAVSGGMNVTAGIGGPPVVLFSINAGWAPERARPTMQAFFFGINLLAIAALGLPHRLPLGLVAGLLAGLVVGRIAAGRVSAGRIYQATLAIATTGSLLAILRGALG